LVDAKLLIITIPTTVHEKLHRKLDDLIFGQAFSMGLGSEFESAGSTTFSHQNRAGRTTGRGEADSARLPESLRPLRTDWPTLVIEAGDSQSMPGLKLKARWWFHASNHHVKIVLLVKWFRQSERIILQKWREVPPAPRTGAVTTRAYAAVALVPDCVQEIEITRAAGITNPNPNRSNPALYNVRNGPLQLAFADLFLRQPDPNQGERHIVITNQNLQRFVVRIWEVVGL
jgi:hypothetical protein